jgi:hypothetical protein
MSNQLHEAIKAILAMPYYKNDNVRSGQTVAGHEEAVGFRVKEAGFTEVSKSAYPKLSKSILRKWAKTGDTNQMEKILSTLPNGSYILQPAGTQGFPDLLIKDFSGKYLALECKSGKGPCPMWNDNVPQQQAIYILSCAPPLNQTTVFLGSDVISIQMYDVMEQLEKEVQEVYKKYTSLFEQADKFNRGFIQKSRKQHFQSGGGVKTNYFTHADRTKCEQNVLNFALAH